VRDVAEFASGAKVKRAGGTPAVRVNARAESSVESEFDIPWSVASSGCDFSLREQFASHTFAKKRRE
jgi:hypothetical protein